MSTKRLNLFNSVKMTAKFAFGGNLLAEHTSKKILKKMKLILTYHKCLSYRTLVFSNACRDHHSMCRPPVLDTTRYPSNPFSGVIRHSTVQEADRLLCFINTVQRC
jgi:hypothetical protein